MSRYIDADALKKDFISNCVGECDVCPNYLTGGDLDGCWCKLIDNAPTVEEQPKGKWIESDVPESMLWKCSVCGYQLGAHSFKYCPICGARMESDV